MTTFSTALFRLKPVWLLLFAVLAGLAWWLWPSGERQPELNTVEASLGSIENVVTAVGNLQPLTYVDVGAQVSGLLQTLHVDIGDQVEEGALLAEIDASIQQARVAASRSQLQAQQAQMTEKRAQLVLAKAQYERQQRLWDEGATSEEAYQSALTTFRSVEAQIKALTAQIEQSRSSLQAEEASLSYTRIYAPMSGTVVSLDARQGQTLNANQVAPILMRIADLSSMTVWTEVSEADVSRLRLGMPAYFTPLGMTNQKWEGTLRQVLPTPTVVNNVVLYTALFDVDNSDGRLMTQMTAQVFFVQSAAHDVITVPLSALKYRRGRDDEVIVVNAKGQQEVRPVKVGINNRILVEIREGLAAGEQVLLNATLPAAGARPGNAAQQRNNPMRGFR